MRKFMLLLTFLVFAAPAWAEHILPADAKRAQTGQTLALPTIQLDSATLGLAPGGTIHDINNRSVTHVQLPADANVLYTVDRNGNVTRIIVLTPQGQARLDSTK